MTFMIIERFYPERVRDLYLRLDQSGRILTPGVSFISSWINEDVTTCYQVMEAESISQIREWAGQWQEYAEFEIIPVIDSPSAKARALNRPYPS